MSAMDIPTTCTRLALSLAITFALTLPAGLQELPNGGGPPEPADKPAPRTDQNSMLAHAQLVEKARHGRIDVYFIGDSIVRRWGALDYPELLANWTQNFHGWNAADFGWGADRTQNILWRLENGELDGVNPKVIVLLAGTNNVGSQPRDDQAIEDIVRGLKAILDVCQQKAPKATIVVTAIFPRNDNPAVMPDDRSHQSARRRLCRRDAHPFSHGQRPSCRRKRYARRGRDERPGQAAPDAQGLSDLGGRVEADPPRVARPAGGDGSRAATDRRSQRKHRIGNWGREGFRELWTLSLAI